jgi:hypothetical protein
MVGMVNFESASGPKRLLLAKIITKVHLLYQPCHVIPYVGNHKDRIPVYLYLNFKMAFEYR